jgi:hypothetical protein
VTESVRTPLVCGSHASVTSAILMRLTDSRDPTKRYRISTGSVARLSPAQQAEASLEVLDQRGATLDPVAVVAVCDAVDLYDFGAVYVTADDALHATPARLDGDRALEIRDVLHRVLTQRGTRQSTSW